MRLIAAIHRASLTRDVPERGKFSALIGKLLFFVTKKLRHPRHFAKELSVIR